MSIRSDTRQPQQPENSLKTVFLDRDGVINRKMPEGEYVSHPDELEILTGVPEAIATLNQRGLRVIVVTNQRGVALGLYTRTDVASIHARLQQLLAEAGAWIDGFYFCPHDRYECGCRKPLAGLFEQARADFPDIKPATSVMIGDSLSDIEFGKNLGLETVFIGGTKERQKPGAQTAAMMADSTYANLPEAVSCIFKNV